MLITSNFTENVTKQPCHARNWWRSLLLLYKLDKRCRWRTGFKKNSMFLELKRLLQEQKYPLQKPRGTLQLKKLIKQVNELVFVNYYRIRSSPNAGELGMKYKVTHFSSLSEDLVKTLCQRLIASYLQRNVFYLPYKFHCDVLKSIISMNKIAPN